MLELPRRYALNEKYASLGLNPEVIVVVPEESVIPEDFPFQTIRLKGLYLPSLVSSRGIAMFKSQTQSIGVS